MIWASIRPSSATRRLTTCLQPTVLPKRQVGLQQRDLSRAQTMVALHRRDSMQDGLDDSGESTAVAAVVGNGHFAHVHRPQPSRSHHSSTRVSGSGWSARRARRMGRRSARYKHWGRSLAACVLQPRVW